MPLPKRRTSRSKQGRRRSHIRKLKQPNYTYCPRCGTAVLPHHVCSECGYYQGRAVLKVEEE